MMSDPNRVIVTTGELPVPHSSMPCPSTIGTFLKGKVPMAISPLAGKPAALSGLRPWSSPPRPRTGPRVAIPIEEKDALQATAPLRTRSLEDHRLADRVERRHACDRLWGTATIQVSVSAVVVILGGRVDEPGYITITRLSSPRTGKCASGHFYGCLRGLLGRPPAPFLQVGLLHPLSSRRSTLPAASDSRRPRDASLCEPLLHAPDFPLPGDLHGGPCDATFFDDRSLTQSPNV